MGRGRDWRRLVPSRRPLAPSPEPGTCLSLGARLSASHGSPFHSSSLGARSRGSLQSFGERVVGVAASEDGSLVWIWSSTGRAWAREGVHPIDLPPGNAWTEVLSSHLVF